MLVPCVIECYLVLNGIKWHTISCTGWYYIALYDVNALRWKQHFADCWEAEKDLKTTSGSDCALNALAIDDPLEYARLYLDGNLQMWVDAEDSLDIF